MERTVEELKPGDMIVTRGPKLLLVKRVILKPAQEVVGVLHGTHHFWPWESTSYKDPCIVCVDLTTLEEHVVWTNGSVNFEVPSGDVVLEEYWDRSYNID